MFAKVTKLLKLFKLEHNKRIRLLLYDKNGKMLMKGRSCCLVAVRIYRVTDGNRTFLKWLVGGSYVRKDGELAVFVLAIQCHFSSYGAVDGRALHVCL